MVTESQSKIRPVYICIRICIFTLFICIYFNSWRSRAKKRANFHFETESKRESMGSLFPCVCRHSRQKKETTLAAFFSWVAEKIVFSFLCLLCTCIVAPTTKKVKVLLSLTCFLYFIKCMYCLWQSKAKIVHTTKMLIMITRCSRCFL